MATKPTLYQPFDKVLSLNEVASIIGKSKKTLWRWWAKDETMPPPLKINGRAIGYLESTIKEFMQKLKEGNKCGNDKNH